MGSNKRDDIVEYTIELISKFGYEGFSYQNLSQNFGLTKATIHHYFPRKEDLGLAICEHYLDFLNDFKREAAEISEPIAKIEAYRAKERGCMTGEMVCPFFALLADIKVLPEVMQQRLRDVAQQELDMLAEIFESGRQQGQFRFEGPGATIAVLFVSAMRGSLSYARALDRDLSRDVLDRLMGLIQTPN